MHTEDSPIERTPDLVAKIRALRQQAERQMDRFTDPGDYDVRHVAGRKPKPESTGTSAPAVPKKKRSKDTGQPSLAFAADAVDMNAGSGGEA